MDKDKKFTIKEGAQDYILVTSEYMGTSTDFKYMIRSELRSDKGTTLFLMGIPNPAVLYANAVDISPDGITQKLYDSVVESIGKFLNEEDWTEGKTYYGEYMVDGSFEISDKKPTWEDGQWGQKI